ncbi:DivIVA domain-containing protein [Spongisporangium articulatum]|uniref:DivIVA domain-containing protein n=1 Tax=Spongisporangium articulatum TaxID=3362603 RepID=A0ABW8AVQ8_9ACTN
MWPGQTTASILCSSDPSLKAQAAKALAEAAFTVTMRGFDRRQVEAYLDEARSRLS